MPKQEDGGTGGPGPTGENAGQRLDKWLWYARIVKSRTLATGLVQDGRVRVNRQKTDKPSQVVRAGDVITVSVHRKVKVLKVLEPGVRRGPAKEAVLLYEDLSPVSTPASRGGSAEDQPTELMVEFEPGAGRPTKKDRRAIDRLKSQDD